VRWAIALRVAQRLTAPREIESEWVAEIGRCWEGVPLPEPMATLLDRARALAMLDRADGAGLWSDGVESVGQYARFATLAPLEGALRRGRGVIVLSAAFGPHNAIAPELARRGYRVGFLDLRAAQRRPESWQPVGPGLDLRVFSAGRFARPVVRFLSDPGSILVTLGDEAGALDAIDGVLLSRAARVATTPFDLARRLDVPIVPAFAVRGPTGVEVLLDEPLRQFETGRGRADLEATCAGFLKVVERHARRRPDHYALQLLVRRYSRYDDPHPLFADAVARAA
jgi:predicted LPLAT superfamily acyltransferase